MRAEILVLSFSRLRSDPRVLKQLALLLPEHRVTTCGYGEAPDGVADHVRIPDDLPSWRYPRAAVLTRRYRAAYRGNAALTHALGALPRGTFDVVLANDLEAAGVALELRPRRGVHLDLHEFAPLQNSELWRFRAFVAPFLRWQLRTFATRAASTTTVCDAIAERYRAEYGLAPGVVLNATPLREGSPRPVGTPIRLVHAGASLRNRRLDVLVRGVADAGAAVTLDLYLAPNDPGLAAELRALAATTANVTVHEPLPFDAMVEALADYDLGVHLLAPTNYNNAVALPNKLFDFVQARLGVITGPSPEMARIVREHDLGVVTDGFDAADLTRALTALTADDVARWKAASDRAAVPLSAERQVEAWRRAVADLLRG